MQIEEAFRDMKNTRNGLGYRHSRTYKPERINILLLLITLSMWIIWLVGTFAIEQGMNYQLQTNSLRKRNVLSTFFIGCYILKTSRLRIKKADIRALVIVLQNSVATEENL